MGGMARDDNSVMNPTPAQLGYRMPAEWEPHEATWIAWPHNREDWPGKFGPIPWVFTEIVRCLSRVEHVHLVVNGRRMRERAADRLSAAGVDLERLRFFSAATDRIWLRDSGPTFLVRDPAAGDSDPIVLLDWRFNGWAKYANHRQDDKLPRRLSKALGLPRW